MLERVAVDLADPHVIEVQLDLGDQRRDQLPNLSRLGVLEGFTQVSQHARGFLDLFVIQGRAGRTRLPSGV